MDIAICCSNTLRQNRLERIREVVNMLNGVQNYFFYTLSVATGAEGERLTGNAPLDWNSFLENHSYVEGMEKTIYITERPLSDNWFSHEEDYISLISIDGWERRYSPPPIKAYLAYQIAQATVSFEAGLTEEEEFNLVHDSTSGCIFDLCEYKEDIKLGMVAGVICPQCQATLRQYGVSDDVLNSVGRILNNVRNQSVGINQLVNYNAGFVVMRYTKNDDNANAYLYGIKAALDELGIRCIRADEQPLNGQILESVCQSIRNSRFIIVKLDCDNLNVYYELGYAMGMEKEVLLISEENLVVDLPTDLRNWACLTYPKGGYETLKNRIVEYFKTKYRY